LCLIACGPSVPEAMRAAWILAEDFGIKTRILNVHTVKPLDAEAIRKAAWEVGNIVTVEEHQVGGFGNIIAGAAAAKTNPKKPLRLAMVGVADKFGESGEPWELVKAFGLSAEHVAIKALELLGKKPRGKKRPTAKKKAARKRR
ncbi:MAG: transketolase C-terminal domain-containing protein, partial [Planctomycetia bacterium]|nr:transketolase C-terminal domain-containing protein [Planctomycetia bacterium]